MTDETLSRRPITSREKNWAKLSAAWLTRKGVQPNTISVFSIVFALFSGFSLIQSAGTDALASPWIRGFWISGAVAGVLGRLICNLLDGMVAVEGGKKTASGEVFNDLPDRISDLSIIVGLGYAASADSSGSGWIQLGWAAGALAVFTAYVRQLGAACGTGHFFSGPMAKQHRMAVTIIASILSVLLEPYFTSIGTVFRVGLVIIGAGSALTCVNRAIKIVRKLESRSC